MKRRRTAKEKNADDEGLDSAAAANRFSTFINEERSKRARTNWSMFAKKIRKALSHTADPLQSALGFFEIARNELSSTRESYLLKSKEICSISLEIPICFDRMSTNSLKGFDNTGNARLWPGGESLAFFLLHNQHLFNEKTVVELGAGLLGLPGIISSFGAKSVVLTDGNANSVRSLANIISHNKLSDISSLLLLFGEGVSQEFELILLADCVFFEEYHSLLLESFDKLLTEDGCVLLCSPYRKGSLKAFLTLLDSDKRFIYSPNLAFDSFISSHLKHLIDEPDLVLPHLFEEVIKAVHLSIIKTSEEVKKDIQSSHCKDVQFSKEVLSKVSGLIFDIVTTHWTSDLLAFSKHGSRQNCNNDDVLLLARRNESLLSTLMSGSVNSVNNTPRGRQQKTNKDSDEITVLTVLPSSPTPFLPPEKRLDSLSSSFDDDIQRNLITPKAQAPSLKRGVTPLASSTPYKGGSLKKSVPGLSCITPIISKGDKKISVLSYIPECEEIIEETTPLPEVLPVIERIESSFTRHDVSPSPSQISSFERIIEQNEVQPPQFQNPDDSFDVFQETPQKTVSKSSFNDSFENDDFVLQKASSISKSNPSHRNSLVGGSSKLLDSDRNPSSSPSETEELWQDKMNEMPSVCKTVPKKISKTEAPFSFSQDSFEAESIKRQTSRIANNGRSQPVQRNRSNELFHRG
ncbi:unnamed protein product [Auanema sp. JU1783]|nr:unnamed protein product [Auanema sp. JU1783]